jgi:uncharacterized membrane protein
MVRVQGCMGGSCRTGRSVHVGRKFQKLLWNTTHIMIVPYLQWWVPVSLVSTFVMALNTVRKHFFFL